MADATGIQWCDATLNPWWGCEKVSPACAHCYAESDANRYGHRGLWGAVHKFRFASETTWAKPLKWATLARDGRLPDGSENLDGHRPRVFCASMADVFEERDELDEHRDRLLSLIYETPQLDWLLLTKRPEFARDYLTAAYSYCGDWEINDYAHDGQPLPNVWLGVSIENARFTWRADVLREIPAAVRFISAEPLLGSLFPHDPNKGRTDDSSHPMGETGAPAFSVRAATARQVARRDDEGSSAREHDPGSTVGRRSRSSAPLDLTGIDWLIIGGESGPGARPFHFEHAREIVRACTDRCTEPPGHRECSGRPAIFVKQLGAKPIDQGGADYFYSRDRKGGDPAEWPADLRIREFPRSKVTA